MSRLTSSVVEFTAAMNNASSPGHRSWTARESSCPWAVALSAAVLLGSLTYTGEAQAEGAAVTHATRAQKAQASKLYRNALSAIDDKKYDDALGLLQQSYNTVASPNSLLVIARTLVLLEREPEAYQTLEEAIRLARALAKADEKYSQTAESAGKELEELRKKVALVVVQPSASVSVDNKEIAHTDWAQPQPFRPGQLKVVIKHADGQETTEELTLSAGQQSDVSTLPPAKAAAPQVGTPSAPVLAPTPPAPRDSVDKRTLAYISGAIGLAGVGTFAAFTVLDRSTAGREGCTATTCPATTVYRAERDTSYETLALVGLGVGVVGLSAGTYLFFTSDSAPPEEQPAAGVAVGPGSVSIHGTF